MSREELREQLARLAEDAPVASVPDDTFRRGRRAVARTRIAGAILAVGCLVVAGVIGGQALVNHSGSHDFTDATARDAPGLPDHIYDYAGSERPARTLTDLPARVAAAYTQEADLGEDAVVVVDPAGHYLPLRLPGLDASDKGAVTLSPDGQDLLWYYRGQRRAETGIKILDLGSGAVTTLPAARLGHPQGVLVESLDWSPDGGSLMWRGQEISSWGEGGVAFAQRTIGGRLRPAAAAWSPVATPARTPWGRVEICDGGSLHDPYDQVIGIRCAGGSSPLTVGGQDSAPLGKLADGARVTLRHARRTWDHSDLWVANKRATWVGLSVDNLSVATLLIPADHPAHSTPAPSWADAPSSHRGWWIGGGVAGLLVLLGGGLWWRRRA